MRILVVTHAFPPDENPRAFRWGAVVERFAEYGHTVDVVTRATHGEPSESTWRPGVVVHRAEESFTGRLREALGGGRAKERAPVGQAAGGSSRSGWLGRVARSIHDRTWKQVFWPDFACLWIGNAARTAGRLLERNAYDGLITVSNPFSSHLVGRRLKPWRRGLPWLVDIGDPFSPVPEVAVNNLRLYASANRAAEKSVVGHADTVMVTTPGTREVYADAFPMAADRIVVVPPSFSLPEPTRRADASRTPGPTRLVFAGRLYRGIRNPQPVLNLLRALNDRGLDLELHVYGDATECSDLFRRSPVGDCVHLHGQVSRSDVWRRMQEADVLVNLGNATSCQLPSKVVEYLWTGRPVLNLVQRDDDSSAGFFGDLPHVLNLRSTGGEFSPPDLGRAASFLRRLPSVDRGTIRRHLEPYSVDAVARQYESLLQPMQARRAA